MLNLNRQLNRLVVSLLLVSCSGSYVQISIDEEKKIIPFEIEAHDYFGFSLDLDKDQLIVGAYGDDDRGENAGAAYVFRHRTGRWVEEGKLLALGSGFNDQVGISVSVSGDFAFVGARGDIERGPQTGAAYVFRRMEDGWVQVGRFQSHDVDASDEFGLAVDVEGPWAVVGAHSDHELGRDAGAVYIYQLQNEVWQFHTRLLAPKGKPSDYFGFSLDLSDRSLIVGAFGDDSKGVRAGAAYIFRLIDDAWKLDVKLLAPDGSKHNLFGHSVALDDRLAVVGAHGNRVRGNFSGAAYTFARVATGWRFVQKLQAPDSGANKYFGFDVEATADRILIGARGDGQKGNQSGAAYLFSRSGKSWAHTVKLIAEDGYGLDFFGRAVAIGPNVTAIGSHGDDDRGSMSGSVYSY